MNLAKIVERIPVVGKPLLKMALKVKKNQFEDSESYWKARYEKAGNSGAGSYEKFAEFKGEVINEYLREKGLESLIEFGSGDGNQLKYIVEVPYTGVDVSPEAVKKCREMYQGDENKTFLTLDQYKGEMADAALSLDVIYHLVEDEVFSAYMERLFSAARKMVIIYASNTDQQEEFQPPHVRHREFTQWVESNATGWKLVREIKNPFPYTGDHKTGSFADFYIYEPVDG